MGLLDFLVNVEMPGRASSTLLSSTFDELLRIIAEAKLVRDQEEAEAEQSRIDGCWQDRMFKSNPEDIAFSGMYKARFAHELMRLVNARCDGVAPVCYRRAGLSRQLYSRTISGRYGDPSRETVMRLALGLQLSYDEAVEFLDCAGFVLRMWHPVDAVFAYCYKHGIYNMLDVNELIVRLGEEPLEIV